MNYSDIQHRFANKQAGKNGCIKAGNVRYEGRNFYSYGTVFGQWLDIEKNVVAIFDGHTSISSSKHQLGKWCFPDDVHVFPLDFGGGYCGWRNCNLVSEYDFNDSDFKEYHRMQMIDHYVERIYNQIAAINGGKKKGLENVSFEAWDYITELCSLYRDTSINKYLKWTKNKDYKKLVKLLKDGERDVKTLTDALFGEGTFKKYWDYCARFRKSANKRAKIETLCERLGIASPYESSYWGGRLDSGLTADLIRKLTAKERNDIHFRAIANKEYKAHESERKEKYNKNRENAFKWIVGYECDKKKGWCGYEYDDKVTKCRNMFTGEEYNISGEYIYGFYWGNTEMSFNYDDFRKSEDKTAWIEQFYAKVKEVQDTRAAIAFLKKYGVLNQKQNKYDHDIYLGVTQVGARGATEEDMRVVNEFIARQDAYFAEQERIERARELQRQREREEEERERAYREQVKQEQIQECINRGVDGYRDLWRLHYMDVYGAESQSCSENFFYGGNVLLRLNLNKDKVETSKNIRIPVEVCKKMWKIVSKWHENPSCFKPMEIDTKGSGRYTISSYKNDILTAGCHKIAYTEMERMYNEIINA